jgi:hypothetical protein
MDIPTPNKADVVADWVELKIACSRTSFSKAQLAKDLEANTSEEADEGFLNSVWDELRRRQDEYKPPPFEVLSRSIRPTRSWKRLPSYLPCLFFSVFGGSEGLSLSAKIFERITAESLRNYGGLEVRVFGWPVEEGDPKDIKTRAKNLAGMMNETFVQPPDEDKKDDTLDVAAWKPFNDSRSSQIVVLMQCGIGKDPQDKANTLRLHAWQKYIHWGALPVPGLAVPSIIPPKRWSDLALNEELLLDRIRIYNLLSHGECEPSLALDLNRWCNAEILRLAS